MSLAMIFRNLASRNLAIKVWMLVPLIMWVHAHCGFAIQTVLAETDSSNKAGKEPNFTQIQDLNPASRPVNRPVRQKWAVVIGISKFADKRLNAEQSFDKTAKQFYKYLTDPQAGRFRADHVRLLTDDEASQQCINNSIGSSFLGKLAGPDDLVVVYIATRAFPTTDGNSYLCSYNCSIDNIYGTCMSLQNFMEQVRKNIQSDRIVLILESAYSGAASLASGAKSLVSNYNFDADSISLGKGLIILSSSRADQMSWKDLFTQNLILALKEKDGLISLNEAFSKAKHLTEYDSVNRIYAGRKQSPVMKSNWQGNDLIIGCLPLDQTTGVPDSVKNFIGAEAHYLNANRAVIANNLDKAVSEYQAAISTDPTLTDARADYAVVLGMKGQWQEAELELRKAIAIKPDDPLYFTNYARILDKLGQTKECKSALEKAYALNPKDRVVLVALSDKCIADGDKNTAMKLIDQAAVLYPNNAVVQDHMCFLLSTEGRIDEAMSHAKEALKIDPEYASARLKLGALYLLKNDLDSAIREYQSVLNKNESNADAHFLLAQAFDKANKRQQAGDEFRKFLQLASPADQRRATAEERLKSLGSQNTQ